MIYGLDFGTSNSAISLLRDNKVEVLPVEQSKNRPEIVPTLIYIGRDGSQVIGRSASESYFRDNVGREVVKQRINTGESIKTFHASTGEVEREIIIEADVNQPGRFFQALKSSLSDDLYSGTDVFGTFRSIEELVSLFLKQLKTGADEFIGQEIDAVVMGRPVFFSTGGEGDELAQARLSKAANLAGFKEVHFQYEPVAAALYYEMEMAQGEELVLVFDFGGGTLDTTVVRVSPNRTHTGNRREDILATGGRVIGGNLFDEEIMEHRLFKYFGETARYGEQKLALPNHIFVQLRSWYTIPALQERQIYSFLDTVSRASSGRKQIKALECLIRKNYGFALFQEIERAKVALSDDWETRISFFQEAIAVDEFLSRIHFETLIYNHLREIERCIDETLKQAGVQAEAITAVLRTGGSSYIPSVQKMLENKFDRRKLRFQDAFANVAGGLGIAAARQTWI
jgi:hypothetical chaperone protein